MPGRRLVPSSSHGPMRGVGLWLFLSHSEGAARNSAPAVRLSPCVSRAIPSPFRSLTMSGTGAAFAMRCRCSANPSWVSAAFQRDMAPYVFARTLRTAASTAGSPAGSTDARAAASSSTSAMETLVRVL
ncbi:MAG: hypothetical protein JWL61_698 [Gemmatimonadetes bacterium]|nr:hypothetical protein [Gemmatimonadota bacterium]